MKTWAYRVLTAAGLLLAATNAGAFPLRSPQVPFNPGPLQAYLNVVDPGINVTTQQLDAQVWSVSVTGNAELTLTLKQGLGQGDAFGVYDASAAVPPLDQIFPPGAVAGWFSTINFSPVAFTVSVFDQNSALQGQTTYPPVNPNAFGFYIVGPCGIWFSQDAHNGGPQMLAYESPSFIGDYWLCWTACHFDPAATFSDLVVNIQSVHPTPAAKSTWGHLKSQYRN